MRIERCERVQLITAAARVIVSSCHDCIFYLGVNRAPLLTGDNRFIQVRYLSLGPYLQPGRLHDGTAGSFSACFRSSITHHTISWVKLLSCRNCKGLKQHPLDSRDRFPLPSPPLNN